MPDASSGRTFVVACGALAPELRTVLAGLDPAGDQFAVRYLPAHLHNHPDDIPGAVRTAVADAAPHDRLLIAYADCGTGGRLAAVAADLGAAMLPGAHCYELFAGSDAFVALMDAEPGTFFLTDFLARNFDALVVQGLGLDRHPELRDQYFGNYRRVVLLAQRSDADLVTRAQAAARFLGLAFEHAPTGLGPFAATVRAALRIPVA